MGQVESGSLWLKARAAGLSARFLQNSDAQVQLSRLEGGSAIGGRLQDLEGRSVLVAAESQLAAALVLLELDGVARRLVLCPPDLSRESIPAIVEGARIDTILSDRDEVVFGELCGVPVIRCGTSVEEAQVKRDTSFVTEWVLFTSGTTGRPKMAVHTLSGLTRAIKPKSTPATSSVWATFYDIRRYGGLQIFLRAMLGNCSFLLSSAGETLEHHLARLADHGVSHISGTPSHWRRVLMSPSARIIDPAYVRLSGEIADQGVLDALRMLYPKAGIVHAYASTEAGVGFEVDDGEEGFPARFVGRSGADVEMKVEAGSLRVRSNRVALCYLDGATHVVEADGFVDTGDLVERRGDRYYFMGRKDGAINVGGQKVCPEEVEAVINRHPQVLMSLVRAKRNPILGSVVVADAVLNEASHRENRSGASWAELAQEVRALCAQSLARHKVPALIRFVPSLPMTAGGKLARHNA